MNNFIKTIVFILITANLATHCYSNSTTILADLDSGSFGKEIISWHNNTIYAWRNDKTLLKGWPKHIYFIPLSIKFSDNKLYIEDPQENIHVYDINSLEEIQNNKEISKESESPFSSLSGSDLNTQNVKYGRFHHLKSPEIKEFKAYFNSSEETTDINITIDTNSAYSYKVSILDNEQNPIKTLDERKNSSESEIYYSWDGKNETGVNVTPEACQTLLEIESAFSEKAVISIPIFTEYETYSSSTEIIITNLEESSPLVLSLSASPNIFCPASINGLTQINNKITKGPGNTWYSLAIKSGTGQTVKILLQNKLCSSDKFKHVWYGETPYATFDKDSDGYADEGSYICELKLIDSNGNSTNESIEIKIISEPELSLCKFPGHFSPNNDGISDSLPIIYKLDLSEIIKDPAIIKLEIHDNNDDLVYEKTDSQLEGIHSFIWNADDNLPEGIYSINLVAKDTFGNVSQALKKNIILDRNSPSLEILSDQNIKFNPYIAPAEFIYKLSDNHSATLNTSITISNSGNIVKTIKNESLLCGLTFSDNWDGRNNDNDYMNEGAFILTFIISDEAGNTTSATCEIMIEDDQRLTSSEADSKKPYINNWIEGSGNYKLIAQASTKTNIIDHFYLPKRQTIKVVTYSMGGDWRRKRCALFDNYRKKRIFYHYYNGTYYYDLPEGSYAILADHTRWANLPEVYTDIYAVDENSVKDYYSDIINIKYHEKEYSVYKSISPTAKAGWHSGDTDEDYILVGDDIVTAKIRTDACDYVNSRHYFYKLGRGELLYYSSKRRRTKYLDILKGIYLAQVSVSTYWTAGWAKTKVSFYDNKFDELCVTSNDSGRNWSTPNNPIQSDYNYYFDNTLGYWGKANSVIHKVEAIDNQLYYFKGKIITEGYHSDPLWGNSEHVFPETIIDPSIIWEQPVQITFTSKDPKNPTLREDSEGNILVAWEDQRNGNYEIYFQKIPYNFEPISSGISDLSNNQSSGSNPMLLGIISGLNGTKFEISNVLNHPNPFNPEKQRTKIRYQLSKNADKVKINIYNLKGGLVRKLSGKTTGKDISKYNDVIWDGRNRFGHKVKNGVYLFEITAERNSKTIKGRGKIVILR